MLFYLIDDSSNDSSIEKLQPYIEKDIVTLFNYGNVWGNYYGRQTDLYNHYIMPRINESHWLLMIDLDEYLWSPIQIDLADLLMKECLHLAQIQIQHTLFGSSGFIQQPKNVVGHFIMRSKEHPSPGLRKYLINTNFEFWSLNIHHATFKDESYQTKKYFILIDSNYFILNHYRIQSYDFWKNVKCIRGDSNNYTVRNIEEFHSNDTNDVEDRGLYEQNKEWLDQLYD